MLRLDGTVAVHAAPATDTRTIARLGPWTPLTGARMALPVLQRYRGPGGVRWLRVRLPVRPNGTTGWVKANAGALAETPWRIVVHRDARRADVIDGDRVRATFPVVVGKPSTPTPLGRFFVTEKLYLGDATEGPWALATSAYSNVLTYFAGGPGQVGLHGDTGFTDPLGSFASHGCIRFGNAAITWIASHVVAGTPILIER